MPDPVQILPSPNRDFPNEPYPGISLVGAALLAGAMMALLGIFGVTAIGLSGSAGVVQLAYATLVALAVATPLIGVRALFGNHPRALVALALLGGVFVAAGVAAEPLGAAPLTTFAVFPATLILAIAAFGWWKWLTAIRRAS